MSRNRGAAAEFYVERGGLVQFVRDVDGQLGFETRATSYVGLPSLG